VGPAFWSAAGGVILPMAGGYFLSRSFGFSIAEAVFIVPFLPPPVSPSRRKPDEPNQLRSKVGSTILGAAVIDDVLA